MRLANVPLPSWKVLSCSVALSAALYAAAVRAMWRAHMHGRGRRSDPASPFHASRIGRTKLNIDHVYMSFADFLWGHVWIAPSGVFMWATGIVQLLIRQRLHRLGLIAPAPCDPALVVSRALLESIGEAVQYAGKVARDSKGSAEVGRFAWAGFPMLTNSGDFCLADSLTIDVDLTHKRMLKAELDGAEISASDAMTLVFFHTFFQGHPKIHAVANWGVNLEREDGGGYAHRCAAATTLYNYLGGTCFSILMRLFARHGVCRDLHGIARVFAYSPEHEPVRSHAHLRELGPFSEAVRFVFGARRGFRDAFERHCGEFPGVDAEAMFVGTVLHSLDHYLWSRNLGDALWLDTDSPRFGVMAEVCRLVKVGFSDDLPGLFFNRRYKTAPGDFFREVYDSAAMINRGFADVMDTCIIK